MPTMHLIMLWKVAFGIRVHPFIWSKIEGNFTLSDGKFNGGDDCKGGMWQ
jgi:hypothetical protein